MHACKHMYNILAWPVLYHISAAKPQVLYTAKPLFISSSKGFDIVFTHVAKSNLLIQIELASVNTNSLECLGKWFKQNL